MVMHSAPRCSKVTMAFWRFRFTVVAFVTFWRSFAGIAQLVEQLICNQQVVGSNPTAGSIHFRIWTFPQRLCTLTTRYAHTYETNLRSSVGVWVVLFCARTPRHAKGSSSNPDAASAPVTVCRAELFAACESRRQRLSACC